MLNFFTIWRNQEGNLRRRFCKFEIMANKCYFLLLLSQEEIFCQKTHPHLVILQTSAICTSGCFIAKLPLFEKMPNGNGHNLSFFIITQRFEPTILSAKFKLCKELYIKRLTKSKNDFSPLRLFCRKIQKLV